MSTTNHKKSKIRQNSLWLWLWRKLWVYKARVIVTIIAMIGAVGSLLAIARGAQFLVDKSLLQGDAQSLNTALLFMVSAALVMAVSSYARATSVNALSQRIGAQLKLNLFDKILNMDAKSLRHYKSGDLFTRLSLDIGFVETFINLTVPTGSRNVMLMVGAILLMATTSAKLMLISLLAVPVLSLPIILMGPRLRKKNSFFAKQNSALNALLGEAAGTVQNIQISTAEASMVARAKIQQDELISIYKNLLSFRGVLSAIIIMILFCLVAFILWSGGQLVINGQMSQGQLAAFVMYAVIAAASMASLSDLGQNIGQARAALERIVELHDAPAPEAQSGTLSLADELLPITFENVTFTYEGTEKPALDDVSFTLNAGQNLALVGPSGAGKSTIFALLLRLYDPQQGVIKIGDTDINDLNVSSLRRYLGLIAQEPDLYNLSVHDNLAFGVDDETGIEDASKIANAHEFITKLSDGYSTILGEKGQGLSVGQKQRLAIARAVLRAPKVLLMDEATSALDAQSEDLVQKALANITQNRSSIVIAHRLSTITRADQILVLENGKIIDQGTHKELIKKEGLYAHLAKLQFLD